MLRESHADNSRQITIAELAITFLSKQSVMITTCRQITCFTGHTTFHSHDHQTDNSLKESCHENSRQATLASLAITIFSRQPRPGSNKQATFYLGKITFNSHDHQTDNLLKESHHDNSRKITVISLATTNDSVPTTASKLHANIS